MRAGAAASVLAPAESRCTIPVPLRTDPHHPGGPDGRVPPRMRRGGPVLPAGPRREVGRLDRAARRSLPPHAPDAARPPEPRATRRRAWRPTTPTANSSSTRTRKSARSSRRSGSTTRPSTRHHGGVRRAGPPSATPGTPPAGRRTAVTPSRSSGGTAASGSGSRSPSTANSPTSPNSATNSSPNHDYHLTRDNDTEVIMHYIAHEIAGEDRPRPGGGVRRPAARSSTGRTTSSSSTPWATWSCSATRSACGRCATPGGPAVRRRQRKRALLNLGFRNIQSLEPGEMILIQDGELTHSPVRRRPRKPAHCFFEWIYFANVASTLDDRSVYLSRSPARPGAGEAGAGARPGAARPGRHRRRAGAGHRQGGGRRDGVRAGHPVASRG